MADTSYMPNMVILLKLQIWPIFASLINVAIAYKTFILEWIGCFMQFVGSG